MLPYLPSSDRHQTILVRGNWFLDLNQGHNQFSLRRFCFNLYDYLWSPAGGNRWPVPFHCLIKLYVLTHIEIQVFFFHNSVKVFDGTWDVERLFLTEQVRRMRRVKVTKKKGKTKEWNQPRRKRNKSALLLLLLWLLLLFWLEKSRLPPLEEHRLYYSSLFLLSSVSHQTGRNVLHRDSSWFQLSSLHWWLLVCLHWSNWPT